MFNVQTNNCNCNSEPVVLNFTDQTWSQSGNEINTHMEGLVQKHNDLF